MDLHWDIYFSLLPTTYKVDLLVVAARVKRGRTNGTFTFRLRQSGDEKIWSTHFSAPKFGASLCGFQAENRLVDSSLASFGIWARYAILG